MARDARFVWGGVELCIMWGFMPYLKKNILPAILLREFYDCLLIAIQGNRVYSLDGGVD
jgi:hypothetical protein